MKFPNTCITLANYAATECSIYISYIRSNARGRILSKRKLFGPHGNYHN